MLFFIHSFFYSISTNFLLLKEKLKPSSFLAELILELFCGVINKTNTFLFEKKETNTKAHNVKNFLRPVLQQKKKILTFIF